MIDTGAGAVEKLQTAIEAMDSLDNALLEGLQRDQTRAGTRDQQATLANHLQPYFTRYVVEPLPVATRLSDEIVTLPLHYGLSDADVDRVIAAVVKSDEGM